MCIRDRINGARPYEGVYAGKTGHTANAGRTLVTAAYRDGMDLTVSYTQLISSCPHP